MSGGACGLQTTDCQIQQVQQAYQDYFADRYQNFPINLDTRVAKKDGPGLSKVHIDCTFPAFKEPWRFVPKFIPNGNPIGFNNNPLTILSASGVYYLT
jgi:hypothetical protein